MLVCHELAHVLTAWQVGGHPAWPVFIPLGIIVLAITRVRQIDRRYVPLVALSGPIVGAMLSLLAIGIGIFLRSPVIIRGASLILGSEIFTGTLGADGSHARKARLYCDH